MTASVNDQMLQLFTKWARSKGYKKPDSADGMKALYAQFTAELQARVAGAQQQVLGAAGDAFYDSDPIARMQRPPILMRDSGGMVDITEPETEESDFAELVRDRARSLEEAGGDDLAAAVIYRNQQHAASQEIAPSVSTAPASTAGQNLGTNITLPGQVDAINALPIAQWVGADTEMCTVGVQFSPSLPPSNLVNIDPRPFGVVQFGTRGQLQTFEVDIQNGCMFNLPASSVLLSVAQDAPSTPASSPQISVGAGLSFGPVMRQQNLTRTVYVDGVGSGTTTALIPIKPFARSVWFFRAPVATDVTIEFHNSALQLVYSEIVAGGANMQRPIPLSDDVTGIVINASGAGNITRGRLVFNLGL